jgi:hypothetical protein
MYADRYKEPSPSGLPRDISEGTMDVSTDSPATGTGKQRADLDLAFDDFTQGLEALNMSEHDLVSSGGAQEPSSVLDESKEDIISYDHVQDTVEDDAASISSEPDNIEDEFLNHVDSDDEILLPHSSSNQPNRDSPSPDARHHGNEVPPEEYTLVFPRATAFPGFDPSEEIMRSQPQAEQPPYAVLSDSAYDLVSADWSAEESETEEPASPFRG